MTTNRGRKRQASMVSSRHSETNDNLSVDDGMSLPGTTTFDGTTMSQVSGEKRRRKKFSPIRREQVAKVRKVGACAECRARRVRCRHALKLADAHDTEPMANKSADRSLEFETSFTEPFTQTMANPNTEAWRQSDEIQSHDMSLNEESEMIENIPASTIRQAMLDAYLDDLDSVIGGNASVGNQVNQPVWGQKSPWMMDATASTSQRYSQPSTPYAYPNSTFSPNPVLSSSTPASSTIDFSCFSFRNADGYCCNVQGCNETRTFLSPILLRTHQEIKHARIFPREITYACSAAECTAFRYITRESLQRHIACIHPDMLDSPAQLPASHMSDHDYQPDRWGQVNSLIAGPYPAGMDLNQTAIPNESTWGGTNPMGSTESPGVPCYGRTQRESSTSQSNLRLQSQTLTTNADDTVKSSIVQLGTFHPRHRINSTTSNLITPMSQPALWRSQNNTKRVKNLTVQPVTEPIRSYRPNSPTPSLIGRLIDHMQISDPTIPHHTPSEIGDEVQQRAIQPSPYELFTATNGFAVPISSILNTNWSFADDPGMGFSNQSLDSHNDPRRIFPERVHQAQYHSSGTSIPQWSGQSSPPAATETNLYNTGYMAHSFPLVVPDSNGANNQSSLHIPSAAGSGNQPLIMLNDAPFQYSDPNAEYEHSLNNLYSSQNYPHQTSVPPLAPSSMTSSGGSESLVSPIDAPSSYSHKLPMNEFNSFPDLAGDFTNVDMNMNTNNDPM